MDPNELIAMIKAGDRAAGSTLVSLMTSDLDTYSRHIAPKLGDLDRETAVDKALSRVVERIEEYDPEKGTLKAWARSFVRFGLLDVSRKPRELATAPEDLETIPETAPGDDADPDRPINPRALALELIIDQLKPEEQTLLSLHVHEGLDFNQIAEAWDPPARADALRKRYQRIRERVVAIASSDPDLQHLIEKDTP